MNQVWKFPIDTTDTQIVPMPKGADILCVQTQMGVPCLWATVDPTQDAVRRAIRIVGTGHLFDADGLTYIGTYQLQGGTLVFHVFESTGGAAA
jgi:hypothetical protein